jgi:uncharacterized protein (TIGR02271 family)
MLSEQDTRNVIGREAYSSDGDKIGKVGQLFLDDQTGKPEFVTVNTGLFGTSESFVPVAEATISDDRLTVPFSKDKVKDAPNVSLDGGHLDESQERRLYEYYGLSYSTSRSDSGLPGGFEGQSGTGYSDTTTTTGTGTGFSDTRTEGHDTSGPTTDEAMTRSEEQLRVGTASQEAGRARLRKYVETEEETHTVPVTKERAVLEREPITDSNIDAATSGPEISEEEHEVVLHEETPVVEKTVEPVERVRLGTEQTTEEHTVTEEVRKERIEGDGDVDDRR